jgi:hypothetical protein
MSPKNSSPIDGKGIDPDDLTERAAILEYDGGLSREEAEALAEFSGKLMSDGMDRQAADVEALKTILEPRRGFYE